MVLTTNQNIYHAPYSYSQPLPQPQPHSQPIPTCSIQPRLFHQQVLNPFSFQLLCQHNQPNLCNSLKCYKKLEIPAFTDCRPILPLSLPQSELNKGKEANNAFLKSSHQTNNEIIKSNGISSNAIFIDFSDMKTLPSQEKLTLEELKKPKRINKCWTTEEDQLLCKLKKNSNLSWREVASRFPARTLNACQFRMSKLKHIKKLKKLKSQTYYIDTHSLM